MSTSDANRGLAATVAGNLRRARLAGGLTQGEVARALKLSDAMAVSRWERGVHRPSDTHLVALAHLLGRDVSWFYVDHATGADTTERSAA